MLRYDVTMMQPSTVPTVQTQVLRLESGISPTHLAKQSQLGRFGVFVAEYVDIWLSAQTTTTGKLAGHVQIYDLQGLSLWPLGELGRLHLVMHFRVSA